MGVQNTIHDALRRGPKTAAELVAISGASQPTVSRILRNMSVLAMMQKHSRALLYGLVDSLPSLPAQAHPVYRVIEHGQLCLIGRIAPIVGGEFWYEDIEDPTRSESHPSLPWFLQDLRPQGFFGRATVRHFATKYGWPADLSGWSDRHVLAALALSQSHDQIGNLLVGDRSADAFCNALANPLLLPLPDSAADRLPLYGRMIASIDKVGVGTSVNGEQPKFCASISDVETGQGRSVLVKFTAPITEDAGRRWNDLLRMESRALNCISERLGIPAARTAIQTDGVRTYLEVDRFDRLPDGGRAGVISLSALDTQFVGEGSGWTRVVRSLATDPERHLEESALPVVERLELFADLIGNTDCHLGNMSVHFNGKRPMSLTPVYDFLPMRYAPTSMGTHSEPLSFDGVFDRHANVPRAMAQQCLDTAVRFWHECSLDPGISQQLRNLSAANTGTLKQLPR